ncbi:MAG: CDP-glycerol glycerophosphotransferase family protein [Polyangiales bacterium]
MPLVSRLTLQNAAATVSLPPYLLARRFLRRAPSSATRWVISGHSGRMYADNAGALHALLSSEGHDVTWISADAGLTRMLQAKNARVLTRNSFEARRAIEQASVLAYSHGPTDLDHLLLKSCALPGLRVHLNHCMSHLKVWTQHAVTTLPRDFRRAPVRDAFDYMLASSPREQSNLQRSFTGAGSRIVIGGGAHLDAFMRARSEQPARSLAYFPTFRDTAEGKRQLEDVIRALSANTRLREWLVKEDFHLHILGHVNSGSGHVHDARSERIHFPPASAIGDVILQSSTLISDYSGVICDYLALDRPMVFFPFDQQSYLRARGLYVDYDQFVFGPRVSDVDALVELIVSGQYRDEAPFAERRAAWRREFFPTLQPTYARRTLDTIERLLAEDAARASQA